MNLRTLKRRPNKAKRRSARKFNFYRSKPKAKSEIPGQQTVPPVLSDSNGSTQKRGEYFRRFREERQIIKILNMNPPSGKIEEYRTIVRKVYYCILPILFARIEYQPDRQILLDIEEYYYNLLNITRYRKGILSRANRLPFELRCYTSTERISQSKQALLSQRLDLDALRIASAPSA